MEVSLTTGKLHSSYIAMNVCGSAYENGCLQWIEYYYDVYTSYTLSLSFKSIRSRSNRFISSFSLPLSLSAERQSIFNMQMDACILVLASPSLPLSPSLSLR